MKIEEGMYVRTNKGTIDKLDNKNIMTYEVSLMGFGEKPIKASNNIIDLIEVGDYVNGKKVYSLGLAIGILNTINFEDGTFMVAEDINTIVTKEQFSSMEYKVC